MPVFVCNLISVFSVSLFIEGLRIKLSVVKNFITQFNTVFDRVFRNSFLFAFYQGNIAVSLNSILGYLVSFGLQIIVQLV